MKKINILITGYNSLVGKAIIKTIYNSKSKNLFNVYSSDYIKPKYYDLNVKDVIIFPDIFKNKDIKIESWIKCLFKFIKLNNINYIFLGIDFELEIYSRFKKQIYNKFKCEVIVNDYVKIKSLSNKKKLQEILKKNEINSIEEVNINHPKKLNFPIILKPLRGTSSNSISKISSKHKIPLVDLNNFFYQKFISGKEYSCGVSYYNNRFHCIILYRELKKGDSIFVKHSISLTKKLSPYFYNIVKKLEIYGPINFQFIIQNKKIFIFEINLRFSGTTYFRSLFGYNEIDIFYNSVIRNTSSKLYLNSGKAIRFYDEKRI